MSLPVIIYIYVEFICLTLITHLEPENTINFNWPTFIVIYTTWNQKNGT